MSEREPTPVVRRDLTRSVLAILLIAVLIGTSFWILRPFLLALVWAMMIVVATWPLMLRVQARLQRRALAVAVMSAAMLLVFIAPLVLTIRTLVEHTDTLARWIRTLSTAKIPPAPDWVEKIPLVGSKIVQLWTEIADAGKGELAARATPYAADAAQWLAGALGGVGFFSIQFLLTVVIAIILYTRGEEAREALLRFGRRLAGERGQSAIVLAGQAIRAVALGVVVTALVQTLLAGLGLAIAGVPFAGLLTALVLLLCIAQVGPILVLAPAVVWLFWSDDTVRGTGLLIWTVIVGVMDNILRPVLIKKGADLPLLLIFAGVIGGLISFGIIGLFVGPVVLAVAYMLLKQWVDEGARP